MTWTKYRPRGRKKTPEVTALQVEGDPSEQGLSATTTSQGRMAFIEDGGMRKYVPETWWIVKHPEMGTLRMPPDVFEEEYEPAP